MNGVGFPPCGGPNPGGNTDPLGLSESCLAHGFWKVPFWLCCLIYLFPTQPLQVTPLVPEIKVTAQCPSLRRKQGFCLFCKIKKNPVVKGITIVL